MDTIKTVTIRLTALEADYVKLLQQKHKDRYSVNISQSDLFRMLLKEKAEIYQLDKQIAELKDSSLTGRMRELLKNRKSI